MFSLELFKFFFCFVKSVSSALITELFDLELRIIYLVYHNNIVLLTTCCTK